MPNRPEYVGLKSHIKAKGRLTQACGVINLTLADWAHIPVRRGACYC